MVQGDRFYLEPDESDLLWSFGIRNQQCWMCDMFHASLEADEEDKDRYYLPIDIFEDECVAIHLEQLIGRDVDIEFEHIELTGKEILAGLMLESVRDRIMGMPTDENRVEESDEEMVKVDMEVVFPETKPSTPPDNDEDVWPDEI